MKSFTRGAENLEKDTESCLSFINKFDGRNIKGEYDWNKDIYRNLEEFCSQIQATSMHIKYF